MSFFRNWLAKLYYFFWPKQSLKRLIEVDYLPKNLKEHKVYVEGDWTAAFICPCGCKERIELNLVDDVRPYWQISGDDRVSIKPSVNKRDGCKSHFFITNGKVIWC